MYCNTYFGCVDSSLSQGQPNLKLFVKVKVKQITEQLFIRVERFRLMQYAIHAKWKSATYLQNECVHSFWYFLGVRFKK